MLSFNEIITIVGILISLFGIITSVTLHFLSEQSSMNTRLGQVEGQIQNMMRSEDSISEEKLNVLNEKIEMLYRSLEQSEIQGNQ
ncbi:hypothetical protein KC614_04115 [candidate division WWE3 bacterium]|uniref:Uncharacterized protein n=1 Tax=candidate division WWE3 bacterium TaxID=2053526 RepID=A0A955LKD3_UNCKA|nr:hypothetical protein [candidate division WWE3 bacterium]